MKQLLLSLALFLRKSKRYKEAKAYVYELLNGTGNPYKKYLDTFIIFLIVTSVFILVYEVKNPVPVWLDYYDFYFVSFVFFIEYILRLWVHNDL